MSTIERRLLYEYGPTAESICVPADTDPAEQARYNSALIKLTNGIRKHGVLRVPRKQEWLEAFKKYYHIDLNPDPTSEISAAYELLLRMLFTEGEIYERPSFLGSGIGLSHRGRGGQDLRPDDPGYWVEILSGADKEKPYDFLLRANSEKKNCTEEQDRKFNTVEALAKDHAWDDLETSIRLRRSPSVIGKALDLILCTSKSLMITDPYLAKNLFMSGIPRWVESYKAYDKHIHQGRRQNPLESLELHTYVESECDKRKLDGPEFTKEELKNKGLVQRARKVLPETIKSCEGPVTLYVWRCLPRTGDNEDGRYCEEMHARYIIGPRRSVLLERGTDLSTQYWETKQGLAHFSLLGPAMTQELRDEFHPNYHHRELLYQRRLN